MNKDVIYIDVEDDITAIIGKVKASKDSTIALVPPKSIGVLQSAVNLRLLARTAKQNDKNLALITNNSSLVALATSANIPSAKNLQATPELGEAPERNDDSEDDIIDGSTLPIGDHAKQSTDDADRRNAVMASALASAPKAGESPKKPRVKKSGPRVPNFDTFRKKALIIGIALVLLIGFLIWAIFFAARATVVISANTNSSSVNAPVTIAADATTSAEANTIRATLQQQSEDKSQTFTATGQKDAGTKAGGQVSFSNDGLDATTVPAGTQLTTSGGLTFVTTSAVNVPGVSFPCRRSSCPVAGSASGSVQAAENGSKYNAATGSLSGAPSGLATSLNGPTSGGVTKTITIVTAEDVQKAKQALVDGNIDQVRNSLKGKFNSDDTVIDQSFAADYGDVKVTPDVGQEASQATLTTKITYKLYGVERAEVNRFLDAFLKKELESEDDQRVYENGANEVTFQEAKTAANGATATLIATAQVGPRIEDKQIKDLAKGKRYGEIQQSLESIQGVESVDVRFFPFWVSSVPDDTSRITVDFNLKRND